MTTLKGITFDHPRGVEPLLASAKTFAAQTGIKINWRARSLQQFADQPIDELAADYDLLIIDHPWAGQVSVEGSLLPLDDYLSESEMDDLRAGGVGASFDSYRYRGKLWAVPVDVAAQVSAYRADLLDTAGERPPYTWTEVIDLGGRLRSRGQWLGFPLVPVDCMMSFMSACVAEGEPCGSSPEGLVSRPVGERALALLAEGAALSHPETPRENPIKVLDRMSSTGEVVYCPLLFGYTNYSRDGFRPRKVRFDVAPSHDGSPLGAILGGTGMGVSSGTASPREACAYAAFVGSGAFQAGPYVERAGQPAHLSAWTSPRANELTDDFFLRILPSVSAAYLRPRFDGFLVVQDRGGEIIHDHLFGDRTARQALDDLDRLWSQQVALARA